MASDTNSTYEHMTKDQLIKLESSQLSAYRFVRVLLLECDQRIFFEIRHINLFSFLNHVRMFPAEQPANMREKETAFRVMRISVCFRVFVVNSMVASPLKHVILKQCKTDSILAQLQKCKLPFITALSTSKRLNQMKAYSTRIILCFDTLSRKRG